jgi:hypothetical protein
MLVTLHTAIELIAPNLQLYLLPVAPVNASMTQQLSPAPTNKRPWFTQRLYMGGLLNRNIRMHSPLR